jgi:D-sedoheptulose 7-phosphate isomerase|tara:strand:- start:570 stop:1079 length:510 start_codon:yes stop_codon:yes gene_type:complete
MKFDFLNSFEQNLKKVDRDKVDLLKQVVDRHKKIIIIGNGGSNSIASHISQDYTKFLKKEAFTFSDPSRLTCYINDYGMENAYKIFLKEFSDKNTLVILISSSGNSINIYNCADFCNLSSIPYVLLTGFSEENKVRKAFADTAAVDFWVDSESFGIVECLHQVILHSIL